MASDVWELPDTARLLFESHSARHANVFIPFSRSVSVMEKRRQPQLEIDQQVTVTVLGDCEVLLSGRVVNLSGRGLKLALNEQVTVGAALKIEWTDTLLLGEVCYCVRGGSGFFAGLQLEHALYNTAELSRLSKRLLDESAVEQPEEVMQPQPRTASSRTRRSELK